MNRFLSASLIYLLGEGLSKGSIFIITPIIINQYGKSAFGEFSLFISLIPFFSILLDLGQRSSVKRFYLDHSTEINLFIFSIKVVPITVFLFLVLVKILIPFNYSLYYQLIVNSFLFTQIELSISLLQISKRPITYNFVYVIRNAFPYYLFIGLTFIKQSDLNAFYKIQTIIFCIIIVYLAFSRPVKIVSKFDKAIKYLKYSLKFSIPLLPAVLSGIILTLSDRYVIKIFYSDLEVGYYSLAYNVCSIFFVFVTAMNKSWQTFILNALRNNEKESIRINGLKYIFITIIILILVYILRNYLILTLANEAFLQVSGMIINILGGMFFYFLYTLYSNVAFYYKDTLLFSIPAIIAAVLNLSLNFIFVPKAGYKIAAVTTLISYFIEFCIIYLICKYKYKFSLF